MKKLAALALGIFIAAAVSIAMVPHLVTAGEVKAKEVVVKGEKYVVPPCCDRVTLDCSKKSNVEKKSDFDDESWLDKGGA